VVRGEGSSGEEPGEGDEAVPRDRAARPPLDIVNNVREIYVSMTNNRRGVSPAPLHFPHRRLYRLNFGLSAYSGFPEYFSITKKSL
jgi:hypothetical protein